MYCSWWGHPKNTSSPHGKLTFLNGGPLHISAFAGGTNTRRQILRCRTLWYFSRVPCAMCNTHRKCKMATHRLVWAWGVRHGGETPRRRPWEAKTKPTQKSTNNYWSRSRSRLIETNKPKKMNWYVIFKFTLHISNINSFFRWGATLLRTLKNTTPPLLALALVMKGNQ